MSLSGIFLLALGVLFVAALGGWLDDAKADGPQCEPEGAKIPMTTLNIPPGSVAEYGPDGNLQVKPMTRLPAVIDLDGWAGIDVIYGGQRIHLSREQIGHYARILSQTCDPAVVGNCRS